MNSNGSEAHNQRKYRCPHLWVIVLAGGEGSRMAGFTQNRLGFPCPKQYCALYGSRSMLEMTVERATRLVDPGHVLTVIGTPGTDISWKSGKEGSK